MEEREDFDRREPFKVGYELPNGATVLAWTWRESFGLETDGKHGVVLCLQDNEYHPFVSWLFVMTPKNEVSTFAGEYHNNLTEAYRTFMKRK